MVRHLRLEYVYKNDWRSVVQGYQRRFKSLPNPLLPSVLRCDIFDYQVNHEKKEISWRIRGYLDPPLPKWLKRLGGVHEIVILSQCVVNFSTQIMTNTIENETLRPRLKIDELCTFSVHPDNPHWCIYSQHSALELQLSSILVRKAENLILKAYTGKFYVARKVDETFISEILRMDPVPELGYIEKLCIKETGMCEETMMSWLDDGTSEEDIDVEDSDSDFDDSKEMAMRIMDVFDVIVVGSGLSGLYAADQLAKSGHSVCVLESARRIGGRVYTSEVKTDAAVDLGGQWIGEQHTNLHRLISELGIKTYPQHFDGNHIFDSGSTIRTFNGLLPSPSCFSRLDLSFALRKLRKLYMQVPLDYPHLCLHADRWDSMSLESWCERTLWTADSRAMFDYTCAVIFGCECREVSFLYFLYCCRSAGGFYTLLEVRGSSQSLKVVGGTHQIAESLLRRFLQRSPNKCLMILNAAVSRLRTHKPSIGGEKRETLVTVTCKAGSYIARRVIVTLPPTMACRLEYEPPLPYVRDQLCQRAYMGCYTKVFVFYSTPFWRNDNFSGYALCCRPSPKYPLLCVFDACEETDQHNCALLGFMCGDIALHMEQLPEQERQEAVIASLARLFGPSANAFKGYLEKQWSQDEWTRGCPVNVFPTGSYSHFAEVLRVPIGRIHWAGSETSQQWAGYMEGAILSGKRVAEEVNVRLRRQRGDSDICRQYQSSTIKMSQSLSKFDVSASGWNGPWCDRPVSQQSMFSKWMFLCIILAIVAAYLWRQ